MIIIKTCIKYHNYNMNNNNLLVTRNKKQRVLNEYKTIFLDKKEDNLSHEMLRDIFIKELILDGSFNKPIIAFPIALQELKIRGSFNQELPEFPNTLRNLEIGGIFNKSIPALPQSLLSITLGGKFNKVLLSLPNNLKKIQIAGEFDKILPKLPESLFVLDITQNAISYNQPLPILPNNMQVLKLESPFFDHRIESLPNSLKELIIGGTYNHILPELPHKLEKLHLLGNYSNRIYALPDSLKQFYIGASYNNILPNMPNKLEHLLMTISRFYNYSLPYPKGFKFDLFCSFPFAKLDTDKFLNFHNTLIEIKAYLGNTLKMKNLLDAHFLVYDYKKNYITFNVSERQIITTNNYIEGVNVSLEYYDFIVNNVDIDKMVIYVNKPIDFLPKSLKYLEFKVKYFFDLPKLPDGLIKLDLSHVSNNVINKIKIPNSVINLITPKAKLENIKKVKSLKLNPGNMEKLFGNNSSFFGKSNFYL